MTIPSILSSPSQKRTFLLASIAVLVICTTAILSIAKFAPSTPIWTSINSLFISIVASGVFALISGLYMYYFFIDPNDLRTQITILPQDIRQTLYGLALRAKEYRIFVRTGRHFRAEILPVLAGQAIKERRPIRLEVVLLDLRDKDICEKYANFRKTSSFDRSIWSTSYVQIEILATILQLICTSKTHPGLIDIHLFLSKRLSSFRIEGSNDLILVTREDPKDTASRYSSDHREFGAYITEFNWIKEEAFCTASPITLQEIFSKNPEISELEENAKKASQELSPYVR